MEGKEEIERYEPCCRILGIEVGVMMGGKGVYCRLGCFLLASCDQIVMTS